MQADTPPAVTKAHVNEAKREFAAALAEALRDPEKREQLREAGRRLKKDLDTGKHKIPETLESEPKDGK